MPRFSLALGLFVPLLALAGCGLLGRSAPPPVAAALPPPPAPVQVELQGTAGMNAGGNAAIVRFYVLASDAGFRRTPIDAFWQDDAAALGADLLGPRREILLYPGEREAFQMDPPSGTAFLGIAADLRDPDANAWRVVYPLEEVRGRTLRVAVDSTRLDVRVGA
jgi:type VI secretion system VasD/TssJ family lipoprotein